MCECKRFVSVLCECFVCALLVLCGVVAVCPAAAKTEGHDDVGHWPASFIPGSAVESESQVCQVKSETVSRFLGATSFR